MAFLGLLSLLALAYLLLPVLSFVRMLQLGRELSEVRRRLDLVERRLHAKASAKAAPAGSAQRFQLEAISAAIKLVVNSAYGYLGAIGLTRFADVHAANDVTARGRDLLAFIKS